MIFARHRKGAETTGIIEVFNPGDDNTSPFIIVSYMVDEKEYTVEEKVRTKSKPIKVGRTVVGHRVVPALPWIKVGADVRVAYDPADPSKGSLPANK